MTLPSAGNPIGANQINVEANRSGTANAPLSGNSSTPQAGSLVKIYEGSGVNQSAPHAYSEFYGKTFSTLTSFTSAIAETGLSCTQTLNQTYYHDGSGTYPVANDTVYTNSAGTTTIANGRYRLDNSTSFTVFGGSGVVSFIDSCSP